MQADLVYLVQIAPIHKALYGMRRGGNGNSHLSHLNHLVEHYWIIEELCSYHEQRPVSLLDDRADDLRHIGLCHLRPGDLGHLKGNGIPGGVDTLLNVCCHFYLLLCPHFLALILRGMFVGSKLTSAGLSGPEMNFLAFQSIFQPCFSSSSFIICA